MSEHTPKEIEHKGDRFKYVDGGCLFGYTKDRTPKPPDKFPWISWKGELMPYDLYQKVIRFFEWSQKEHKSEALVYLYYNEKTQQWLAWAPPQDSRGMTVKAKEDHENFKQCEAFKGFMRIGTAHHHCTMGAFASGTDQADEAAFNGLHYTIGKLDESAYDYHFRATFNGNTQLVHPEFWIGLPDGLAKAVELAPELMDSAYKIALSAHAPKEMEVPEQWKANFFRETWQSSQVSSHYNNNHSYKPGRIWDKDKNEWVDAEPNSKGTTPTGGTGAGGNSNHGSSSVRVTSLVTQQSAPTSENHGGVSDEELADIELSAIVWENSLTENQLKNISVALCSQHYRTGIKGEHDIEALLEKYKLPLAFLTNWISENREWSNYQGA